MVLAWKLRKLQLFSAAAGLDTTKEDYWYKYNKMRLKELVDASKGQLKRDYSAEKIGGTKGRPYKPVRIPKKRLDYKAPQEAEKGKSKKNKDRVNWEIVNSPEYKKKFSSITNSEQVNNTLYKKAIDILKDKSGTEYETLHLIDLDTGKVVATSAHTKVPQTVSPNKEVLKAVRKAKPRTLVGIHNHPNSLPPSGSDFSTAKNREYYVGVVACHNGDVWVYKARKPVTSYIFDMQVANYKNDGYTDLEAYEKTMRKIGKDYGLEWRKL